MRSSPHLLEWLGAFAWTLALELPVYWLFLRTRLTSWSSCAAVVLGLNLLTHPALWFVVPYFTPDALWFVAVETGVTLVEAGALFVALRVFSGPGGAAASDARTASIAAVTANSASALLGLLIY